MTRNNKLSKIRRSRVLEYGPGSIIDFTLDSTGAGSISVVSAGLEYWDKSSKKKFSFDKQTIREDRLKKKLGVIGFRLPPVNDDNDKYNENRELWGFRFPRYLICPRCRTIKWYSEWQSLTYGDPQKICTSCSDEERKKGRKNNIFAVPTRFVVACKNGHLDDFPWFLWVHGKENSGDCKFDYKKNIFKLSSVGEDMGLSGLVLKCMKCNTERSLDGIFSGQLKGIKCLGKMPWIKHEDGIRDHSEKCDLEVEARQRGAGDLYKPIHLSSLTIPPFDEKCLQILYDANLTMDELFDPKFNDEDRVSFLKISLKSFDIDDNEIKKINEKLKWFKEYLEKDRAIYWEEYLRFMEEFKISESLKDYSPDREMFEIREQKIDDHLSKYLSKLVKVVRLRETRSLVGFTRIVDAEDYKTNKKNPTTGEEFKMGKLFNKDNQKINWLPAIEIRGEGIFISLNEKRLEKWEKNKALIKRASIINEKYIASIGKKTENIIDITPRYLLVHSLAHSLISELAKVCGYNEASLRERLYISDKKDEKMSGILIYTSSSDSEGTLGGLSRQADLNRFKNIFLNAIKSKHNCSQDPHCIMGIKSASEQFNHAACHACMLLPETSCQNWNRFLDRAMLRGDINDEFKSFFDFE